MKRSVLTMSCPPEKSFLINQSPSPQSPFRLRRCRKDGHWSVRDLFVGQALWSQLGRVWAHRTLDRQHTRSPSPGALSTLGYAHTRMELYHTRRERLLHRSVRVDHSDHSWYIYRCLVMLGRRVVMDSQLQWLYRKW